MTQTNDMPGFVPCETDQVRQAKYIARRQEEERMREAIRNGVRAYDRR